ncbi:outer membrane receptor protein, mostly Fe transport [Serpentinimonas raichei]|uniref:Outer membrane receptor protein, mostly Fe transport n=1 Tax=Serpentinimonas raichei TaxID=1458425 RepID=A0A060NJS2_9BURK|nr:hypothetical protein [Serpentinimonas raichei]BAO81827.1 outer membrane receptor protein, mostly Fe transport [Serpentinimonas raichei]
MADLSHWDLAEIFTGRDAAYLMMGVDPSDPEASKRSAAHVLRRMETAFDGAIEHAMFDLYHDSERDDESDLMPYHAILGSEARRKSYGPFRKYDDREPLEKWLKSSESGVQNEEFSRAELARWVRENGLKSAYQFDLEASVPATQSASGATVPQAETPAQGTADDTPAATAVPNSRERNTLLRIIGGLAMATYKMNIHGRMDGITEILDDLAQHGVTVSEETLRGKLREAARLIDPPADNKG